MVLRRQGSRSDLRPALKEKFVSLYEDVFALRSPIQTARDEGFAGRQTVQRFWDELLLLKVNEAYLAQCVAQSPEDQLVGPLRNTINDIVGTCVRYLNDVSFIRVAHALETLTVIIREIFRKRFNEQCFTIITLLAGSAENGDTFFKRLISDVATLLMREDVPILIKALGLRLFLVILTGTDNVNTNSIASYLFVHNICDALVGVLTIKIPDERRRLELDAALVMLILFLWRESSNMYADRLGSSNAPLLPLLHTAGSLLSRPTERRGAASSTPLQKSSDSSVSSNGSMGGAQFLGYAQAFFGMGARGVLANGSATAAGDVTLSEPKVDLGWSNVTAGIMLIYFLVYLNPAMKSTMIWGTAGFTPGPGQALALLWGDVFRAFLGLLENLFGRNSTSTPGGILQAKLCLVILRCFLEDPVSSDFLLRCDPTTFTLVQSSETNATTPGSDSNRSIHRGVTCVILDMVISLLADDELRNSGKADPDLYLRAVTLVAIVVNYVRGKGKLLTSIAVNWKVLWSSLVQVCTWCSDDVTFQRPGVPEVAEAVLGFLEACLGAGQEFFGSPEEVEKFHAMIFSSMPKFEALERTAQRIPFGGPVLQSINGGIKLVNVKEVKTHYEVQVAAMGIRGNLTEAQALIAVQKKGLQNIKLKPRHTGPAHAYIERTSEHRILVGLSRLLVTEHRRYFWATMPKFEMDSM